MSYFKLVLLICSGSSARVCVVVDSSCRSFSMDGVLTFALDSGTGLWTLGRLIRRGAIPLDQLSVLFAFVGRAEVPSGSVLQALEDVAAAIQLRAKNVLLVVSAPIPTFTDSQKMVGRCVNAGKLVRGFVTDQKLLEFSRIAEEFYTKAGVNATMLGKMGISAVGRERVQANIISKLRSQSVIKLVGNLI